MQYDDKKRNDRRLVMNIIDAHIHFCPGEDDFRVLAEQAGHAYTEAHLRETFARLGVVRAVVMGNGAPGGLPAYPAFLRYCVGLDRGWDGLGERQLAEEVERHLRRRACAGIKLYPGYHHRYVGDRRYAPLYELAAHYGKPVAIHTGATAGGMGLLKYAHPLTVDEAAVQFPQTTFVMCHFGNPWLTDAAAVMEKNRNVYADLSGLLEGRVDLDALCRDNEGYFSLLRTWMAYANGYEKLMYGTDWPLVNLEQYLTLFLHLIPARWHEAVFYQTARRVYAL